MADTRWKLSSAGSFCEVVYSYEGSSEQEVQHDDVEIGVLRSCWHPGIIEENDPEKMNPILHIESR